MKYLLFILLAAISIVACKDENSTSLGEPKKVTFKLNGLVTISSGFSGRTEAEDPTYFFIELLSSDKLYASGVFKELKGDLDVSLANNTNYTLRVKAVKKGWSYGVRRYVENGRTTINWAEVTDVLVYQNPFQNGANAGLAWVYTKADSSATMYQYYPQTDTYFGQFSFNSGILKEKEELTLKRQIFGIETSVINFKKGKVTVTLAEGLASEVGQGVSKQEISFPTEKKLDIFTRQDLASDSDNIHLRVLYFDGTKEFVVYDGFNQFNRLEKKMIEVDLSRFDGTGGRAFGFKLEDAVLTNGETIKLN